LAKFDNNDANVALTLPEKNCSSLLVLNWIYNSRLLWTFFRLATDCFSHFIFFDLNAFGGLFFAPFFSFWFSIGLASPLLFFCALFSCCFAAFFVLVV